MLNEIKNVLESIENTTRILGLSNIIGVLILYIIIILIAKFLKKTRLRSHIWFPLSLLGIFLLVYKDGLFSIFAKYYDDIILLLLLVLLIQIFFIYLFFKVSYYLKTRQLLTRKIHGNYPVAMISMLHNKKIEGKKDIFDTILNLINRVVLN